MFRVDERFEIESPLLQEDGVRRFWVVEQCFNHLLWQIQVLSPASDDKKDVQCWTRLLVARTSDAISVLLGEAWAQVEVHLVLPGNVHVGREPALTKCFAVWECVDIQNEARATWVLETSLGDYVDPKYGVKLENAKKVALRWANHRVEETADPLAASERQRGFFA